MVDLFIKLVQIDSPSGEESLMREYLKNKMMKLGFISKTDKVGNLFLYTKDSKPKILICAHMDTVSPGKSIRPTIVNGVIKSDGNTILGADNKATISSVVCAVEEYKKTYQKLPRIEVLFSVKEETGGGVEFFPFSWIKSKKGLTFDYAGSLGTIILAAPYIYNFRIKFVGKPAHSSRPEEGKNALSVASEFLNLVRVGAFDNHATTINIGRVTGGSGINIIPEEVMVEGEVRSTIKNKFDSHLKEIIRSAKKTTLGTGVKVSYVLDGYCPGYDYDKSENFIKELSGFLKENGNEVKYETTTGVSDVNSLVGAGLTAVCLSDGIKDPHTKKESVSEKNLVALKDLILRIISGL